MEPKEYLKKLETIQSEILNLIDQNDNSELNYQNLIIFLEDRKIQNDKHTFKLILHFISKISNNYHRCPNFFNKIEQILTFFKSEITNLFKNSEIFNIFKGNKRILLFLIEEKILIMNKRIAKEMITKNKFNESKYLEYFLPEIQQICDEYKYRKIPDNFFEKRKAGEDDDFICEVIRNDLIEEFVLYVNRNNYPLPSKIKPSMYETHPFLIDNYSTTLIEYAAFFGSIQIFQYLVFNKVRLNKSLWIYAIHSNNPELIHFLEENQLKPDNASINQYFIESIKCHHNDIANYIQNVYFQIEENKIYNFIPYCIRYYNFALIKSEIIKFSFFDLCKYDYFYLVDFLLNNEDIDINNITISSIFLMKFINLLVFNRILKIMI